MAVPRVRFAPAPSGWLHVGGARTALYNWLYARGGEGAFVLRIEDTDAERVSDEAFAAILEALRFLGLDWDEGPDRGGPHGPYRQSERMALYAAVVAALLEAGHAYDAWETPDELEAQRREAQAAGQPPGYRGAHRDLTDAQREAFRTEGRRPVIRLRTPDDATVSFDDAVRGRVEFAWKDVSDFVIQRADGSPTYFLANATDDLAMGINFIARGEDLLSATPRQLLVYQHLLAGDLLDKALADSGHPARPVDEEPPRFAHLPLLVGRDRKPLSKRHGSVAVDEFRRQGFLPEVLVNFLALCGWSYDGVRERFTVDELVELFSFDRVGKNPAYFDPEKLRAFNGDGIKELSDEELTQRLQPYLTEAGLISDPPAPRHQQLLLGLAPLLRDRIQTLAEAEPLVAFCFRDDMDYDERAISKHLKGTARDVLEQAEAALATAEPWSVDEIMAALERIKDDLGIGRGKAFQPVRVAVAGTDVSPPLPETLALLDRELVLKRIRAARQLVGE
jgi:glutamyl-tRNA synthetase